MKKFKSKVFLIYSFLCFLFYFSAIPLGKTTESEELQDSSTQSASTQTSAPQTSSVQISPVQKASHGIAHVAQSIKDEYGKLFHPLYQEKDRIELSILQEVKKATPNKETVQSLYEDLGKVKGKLAILSIELEEKLHAAGVPVHKDMSEHGKKLVKSKTKAEKKSLHKKDKKDKKDKKSKKSKKAKKKHSKKKSKTE